MQAQFREMEGGYHRANVELKAYLRDGWVLPALPVLVEESAAALGDGASEDARREHADLCGRVGGVLKDYGKYEPALAHYEMELEIRLALEGPEGLGVAVCYGNMGAANNERGDIDRALPLYQQAAAIYEAKDPGVGLANTFHCIATVHNAMEDYDRALELYGQAAAITEAKDPGSVGLAYTYNGMGIVHKEQGDNPRALERYGQAAAIYEAKDPDSAAGTYGNMALVYEHQKDYGRSLEYHRKALAIFERVHGPNHPSVATVQLNMGTVLDRKSVV